MRTFRPVDPLAAAPRYTALATVKARLGIPAANTTFDARVTASIVAAEVAVDTALGRRFPDLGVHTPLDGWWRYQGTSGAPAYREVKHTGTTELRASIYDIDGVDRTGDLDLDPELSYPPYLAVFAHGLADTVLAVTAQSLHADGYWTWTTTAVTGDFSGLTAGAPVHLVGLLTLASSADLPAGLIEAATDAAVAVYKLGDSPTGTLGADEFIGSVEVSQVVRQVIRANPLLAGLMTRDGFGVA